MYKTQQNWKYCELKNFEVRFGFCESNSFFNRNSKTINGAIGLLKVLRVRKWRRVRKFSNIHGDDRTNFGPTRRK